jgi:methionyl-tRNA formyltransferase
MGNEGITLAGLLTRADSPKGRSGKPEPTECAMALAAIAAAQPIPVLKPEKLDRAAREQTAALNADLLVSFAYGKIFGPQFLALFPLGGINIHPSLLPRYRGAAPIPAAIINQETATGITIQRLATEMDTGDILVQETMSLNGRETTASLSGIMAQKAAQLLPAALRGIADGTLRATPQDHAAATYCPLIQKEDGVIDWSRGAAEIDAQIRAFDPWPLSWTMHGELQLFVLGAETLRAKALRANAPALPGQVLGKDTDKGILIQTGDGILAVSKLQYRTKKAMNWKEFLNGARSFMGARLGSNN